MIKFDDISKETNESKNYFRNSYLRFKTEISRYDNFIVYDRPLYQSEDYRGRLEKTIFDKNNLYQMINSNTRKRKSLQKGKIAINFDSTMFKVVGQKPKNLLCFKPENQKNIQDVPIMIHTRKLPSIYHNETSILEKSGKSLDELRKCKVLKKISLQHENAQKCDELTRKQSKLAMFRQRKEPKQITTQKIMNEQFVYKNLRIIRVGLRLAKPTSKQ